ncbi:hypothetical protein GZH47_31865 (plasmid) [Paenibacillus rhizovicinus]|uniref:Large polyvalent protein-associated domain-containing protein n=1 Tax=Paenibacillus rhizovicinus TaxID=2704463 RepID=A0A6C0PCC5_9BACL|nr:LPD1 domain-containing protein [Paenibacillus rhizovicinus]QHW35493.1 hypothetical protein GZH47_31865 [Paenibacillus rhizovicinus]
MGANQLSLFDYFPGMFSGTAAPAVLTAVIMASEAAAPDTGRKQYSYDVGEELKGARKHLASLLKFSTEWYAELEKDPTQAFEAICRDELLGAFPIQEYRERGFSSEVAYAIKQIWDRVCQRPEDNTLAREHFVKGIAELKQVFSEAYAEAEFRSAFETLQADIKKATWSKHEHLLLKDPTVANYAFWLSLGDRFNRTFLSGGRGKEAAYRSIFDKAFSSEEGQDWTWTEPKARSSVKGSSKERWERRVPKEVIRLSQEPSGVEKPEDLMTHYGYRGIQFGNWMEDAAGRYHVLCSGNAHADLAAILNIPRHSISFYGALGLAFGSRGTGKASAHFEPFRNVINLTKMNGGGALCHEWAHALDFNLNSWSHGFANGMMAPLSACEAKLNDSLAANSIKAAFARLMEQIKKGNGTIRHSVPSELPPLDGRYGTEINRKLERAEYDVSKALMSLKGLYRIRSKKKWIDLGMYYCHLLKEAGREVPSEFFIPTDFSAFFLDAKERGEYWRRDHELFARAFEAWIEDELVERGMTNSYLVSGTRCEGPYPQGSERIAVNAAFREWWRVLLASGVLQDEQTWSRG